MTNRRVAIQQLLLIWAGIAFLPGCLQRSPTVSIPLKSIKIDPEDEAMLADLAEIILPKTDTPGARDIFAHLFVLKMVDDCATQEQQENYMQGMKEFESFVEKKTGKSFTALHDDQKKAIVAELNQQKPSEKGIGFFYQATKYLTIEAYTTCEFYLTKIRGYKMLPGKFQGCVPLQRA
jgi:hypothetical protein